LGECPRGLMKRKETIVEHDARLILESLRDFFKCEICDKWRHVPGRRYESDDNFTCSMAGFHCDEPEDKKWTSLPGFSGATISARDEDELKKKPMLENSIRHMLHKVSDGDLWKRKTGDRAESEVNAMLNELQDPKSLELTVLGRGPERVDRLKRILEWIWDNAQIQRENDRLMTIWQDLTEVSDRLRRTSVAAQHRGAREL